MMAWSIGLVAAGMVVLAKKYQDPEHRAAAAAPFRDRKGLVIGGAVAAVLVLLTAVQGEGDLLGYLPVLTLGALVAALVGRASLRQRPSND
ncbi:hypothetical protein [uncultured Modestobacter sp.]|uniref:hypothetical protein n=1 Tax=uncultured Modestobacter sp. TaxID=380048 RepID=UPI00262AF980|nr:hypothetical protein [uncultured Modestobacter sp.]